MKPIPKTITIKCSKDIYDEIKKFGYFPSTEFILPEDEVKFVSIKSKKIYLHERKSTNGCDCNNSGECDYCLGMYGAYIEIPKESYGTHKAILIAIGVKEDYQTDLSEKLYNGIKENFKGSFNMYKLENDE